MGTQTPAMTASVSGARPRGTSKPHRGAGVSPHCFWTVPRASTGLLEGMTVLAQARCKPSHLPRMVGGLPSRVWAPEKPRGPPFSPESYFLAKPTLSSKEKGGAGGLRGRWEKPRL